MGEFATHDNVSQASQFIDWPVWRGWVMPNLPKYTDCFMTSRSLLFCLGLLSITPLPALAEDQPVVVELFTSQGCNSCPPADALFERLAQNDDVIALSLHVDYWDYIGWADSFAKPEFTERQKNYARAAGARSIYTPQFIIGGRDQVVGAEPMPLVESIHRQDRSAVTVTLDVERDGGMIEVDATAQQSFAEPLIVQVVRFMPHAEVAIERGENAGKRVTYANIVTDWDVVSEWNTQSPLDLEVAVDGDEPAVVIVQEPGPGAIVAAARAF